MNVTNARYNRHFFKREVPILIHSNIENINFYIWRLQNELQCISNRSETYNDVSDLLQADIKLKYKNMIFTPIHITKEMVDLAPEEVWNPYSTFIDIYSKSGIFLVHIFNKLFEKKRPRYSQR